MTVTILHGDCRDVLKTLPSESVHCCVTSPPYWGLRDYGVDGQIGLETTLDEFIDELVDVFTEVRRVLRSDGTCWVNMGDSYCSTDKWGGGGNNRGKQTIAPDGSVPSWAVRKRKQPQSGLKPKDLIMQPARLALALQADGWWLRSEIIWAKTNPMPESVKDRPGTAHEKIFLLTKSSRYFYDSEAVFFDVQPKTLTTYGTTRNDFGDDGSGKVKKANFARSMPTRAPRKTPAVRMDPRHEDHINHTGINGTPRGEGRGLRNYEPAPLEVWSMATRPVGEAHFATFPPELAERCIKAGCPADGTVLDPFGGAGTTGLVADRLGRDAILIELNPEYAAIAERRIRKDAGFLSDVNIGIA